MILKSKKINRNLREQNHFFLVLTILVFFAGDLLRKLAHVFGWQFYKFNTISKVLILVSFLIFFLLNIKFYLQYKEVKKRVFYILILCSSFIIGQYFLKIEDNFSNLVFNIEFLAKFLFILILLVFFSPLFKNINLLLKGFEIFEIIFFINLILILLGFLFKIELFETYYGSRTGYSGIYAKSGVVSYHFIILILYYYRKAALKNNYKNIFIFSLVLILSFFVGTKKIFLFYPILLTYHLMFGTKFHKKQIIIVCCIISILTILFFKKIKIYISDFIGLFHEIYLANGFMSSLTSFRSDKLTVSISEFVKPNWSLLNYIFGGGDFSEYE